MSRPVRRIRTAAGVLCAIIAAVVFCSDADAASRRHAKPVKHHTPAITDDLGRPPRPEVAGPIKFPDSQIEPVAWANLDEWPQEDHAAAFSVFRSSCRAVIGRAKSGTDDRPVLPALAENCRRALAEQVLSAGAARSFFENNFTPVRINKLGDVAGFITGYYEPIVAGSRFPTREFTVPVYRRPPDLIPPAGAARGQGFPNTGKSTRKLADGTMAAYYERGDIENGVFDGQHLEICWLRDPIDLFFIQIQGSGRVRLEDGTMLRVNYDSHNGHPYTAIGRILIERKEVPREEMSMDRIRQWMAASPDGGKELRSNNKSYVFFRIVGLSDDREAVGAQGVPLTPRRSIAVDKALHVYGTPFFIEAELPINTPNSDTKFRRVMIAQDTGSAIVGPARADIYYGAGDEAGRIAGRFRNPGRFDLLLPRVLDPVIAGAKFPLPPVRPTAETASAQRVVTGAKETPLPRARPKIKTRARWRA
jgi:membrane-bound lytic murein transglycosylase A